MKDPAAELGEPPPQARVKGGGERGQGKGVLVGSGVLTGVGVWVLVPAGVQVLPGKPQGVWVLVTVGVRVAVAVPVGVGVKLKVGVQVWPPESVQTVKVGVEVLAALVEGAAGL